MLTKVYSFDRRSSVDVELKHVTRQQYKQIKNQFVQLLIKEQAYLAIAHGFTFAVNLCPNENPSDLWQHVIYRIFIEGGRNEQSWKRASGQGFEYAFSNIYNPRLTEYGVRLAVLTNTTAVQALKEMGLTNKIAPSKMDIVIEGNCGTKTALWKIFGVIHAKTSIAERIKDDAPASKVIMQHGLLSVLATLDSKSFPPPHGNGINYGELGGRTAGQQSSHQQFKREYFEVDGDFHNGYSYNLRTPPSNGNTPSGSKIKTLSFNLSQPDKFVLDVVKYWKKVKSKICGIQPTSKV